jgi:hypothetical protein
MSAHGRCIRIDAPALELRSTRDVKDLVANQELLDLLTQVGKEEASSQLTLSERHLITVKPHSR